MKNCRTCNFLKDVTEFSNCKRSPDGLRYCCKSCDKERRIKYKNANPDKKRIYRNTPERLQKMREAAKKWRKENPERVKDKLREWNKKMVYSANPKKASIRRAKQALHRSSGVPTALLTKELIEAKAAQLLVRHELINSDSKDKNHRP